MDIEFDSFVWRDAHESSCVEEAHFTGGLRGMQFGEGWALVPMPVEDGCDLQAFIFRSPESHLRFASECGSSYIGSCMKYRTVDGHSPMDVWEAGARDTRNGLCAADSWGGVALSAERAGDGEYARYASYISACLQLAGLRLRDVSDGYHNQLRWALQEGRKAGVWFSNASMQELYANFHSLASELSSARDHLARIAAIEVGASKEVDSLSLLERWRKQQKSKSIRHDSLMRVLLFELGPETGNGWLRRLGKIRNQMLHRTPMARDPSASAFTLVEVSTRHGPVRTVRLGQPTLNVQESDPLIELAAIFNQFEQLARTAWGLARYPVTIPNFVPADPLTSPADGEPL